MRTNWKVVGILAAVALSAIVAVQAWAWETPSPDRSPAVVPHGGTSVVEKDSSSSSSAVAAAMESVTSDRVEASDQSKAGGERRARRLSQVPQTTAEQQAMIEGCLRPQAEGIAMNLTRRYEDLVSSLSPSQTAKLTGLNRSVIWDLARANIGYELAINEQLQAYVASGKQIPDQEPDSGKSYVAVGQVFWGGRPGPVWGADGTIIKINFAFTREEHPILDRARTILEEATARFHAEFPQ